MEDTDSCLWRLACKTGGCVLRCCARTPQRIDVKLGTVVNDMTGGAAGGEPAGAAAADVAGNELRRLKLRF